MVTQCTNTNSMNVICYST